MSQPGALWPVALKGLWYDYKENWQKAHECVQDGSAVDEAWIHAYLHRKEGDMWNADYWYRRAGRKRPEVELEEERDQILEEILMQDWNKT